jgi:hypothetical protein
LNTQIDLSLVVPKNDDAFIHLVFGLQAYFDNQVTIVPSSLRHTLNLLAFAMPNNFPKTLQGFLDLCRQPVSSWFPYNHHNFNSSWPILYEGNLSEEAQEYYFGVTEQMQYPSHLRPELTRTALDNLKIVELRNRLKNEPDRVAAQDLYVWVRSFLIEQSWRSLDQLRAQSPSLFQELSVFYEEIPVLPLKELMVCERCGLLEWRADQWQGVKPRYCSDHGSGSPYIQPIRNSRQLYRLKRGIHLRTFLPGQIELALFTFSENLQSEYPNHLRSVERYPGLDTYDLRLTFSDGEIWAVDAKDQAQPERLALDIRLPYGEGDLAYTHAFYVLPDSRLDEWGYRDTLKQVVDSHSSNLYIASLTEFQQRTEKKLQSLINPSGRKKSKRV